MIRRFLRRHAAAVGLVISALVSVSACGGHSGAVGPVPSGSVTSIAPSGSSASPATAGGTSTRGAAAEREALVAYRAAYADWQAASTTSNYQDPALAHHLSGQALSYVTRSLRVFQSQGSVAKGKPVLRPTAGQVIPADDPTQVVVNDVVDDRHWLQYTTDGHLYNDVPGGCHQSQALVVKADGGWKVDQLAINKAGAC